MATRGAVALLLLAGQAAATEIAGPARVLDADMISVGGTTYALFGIDAPEPEQPCKLNGEIWHCNSVAVRQLEVLLDEGPITCRERDFIDRTRRTLRYASCMINGRDLAEAMVRAGMALAYRNQTTDYVAAEEAARAEGAGIWQSEFIEPWVWRQEWNRF
jgi:endonuclease YncB( thermonuclease family)